MQFNQEVKRLLNRRPLDLLRATPHPPQENNEDLHQLAYNLSQLACQLVQPQGNYPQMAANLAQVASDLGCLAATLAHRLGEDKHEDRDSGDTESSVTTWSSLPPLEYNTSIQPVVVAPATQSHRRTASLLSTASSVSLSSQYPPLKKVLLRKRPSFSERREGRDQAGPET